MPSEIPENPIFTKEDHGISLFDFFGLFFVTLVFAGIDIGIQLSALVRSCVHRSASSVLPGMHFNNSQTVCWYQGA